MKNINRVEWEVIRKQGLFMYLLLNWTLFAALPATIVLTIFRWIIEDRSKYYFTSGIFLDRIIFSFVLCLVLAITFGLRKWFSSEKAYKQANIV